MSHPFTWDIFVRFFVIKLLVASRRKQMKRKLLSIFLAAVMLLGTLSIGMTVSASSATYSDVND